ncbi:protein sprT [Klebsiella michiganensis]|uniref:Protein sprT n=1 Tax=Klebsiella michiganensis TaxID=1134687 RepID=A0A7H4M664_9ENTR|nr:protein sprT [Klebsiella michiganensis]
MRSLRENLAKANLKLGRHYPEPVLVYQQRGTSAGTAWLEKNEIRLNPVLLLENQQAFMMKSCRTSWPTCWCGSILAAWRRTAKSGNG